MSSDGPKSNSPSIDVTVGRLIVSVLLAYPLSGALYAIWLLIKLAFTSPSSLKHIGMDFIMVGVWIVMVPACAGFVPRDEGDVEPRINMYPWIIPTAVTLFFLFSRGWNWFSGRYKRGSGK